MNTENTTTTHNIDNLSAEDLAAAVLARDDAKRLRNAKIKRNLKKFGSVALKVVGAAAVLGAVAYVARNIDGGETTDASVQAAMDAAGV